MTQTFERSVLFADLRGSTGLYESLGNAEATAVVTHSVSLLADVVTACKGAVVKTLGDGLMAMFVNAYDAVEAADQMHEALERMALAEAGKRGPSRSDKLRTYLDNL